MTWSNIIRGVAIGDSWGDPAEFDSIDALTKNDPKGPELPQELRITDDTQMTLYLASALDVSWNGPVEEVKQAIIEAFLEYRTDPDNNRAPGVTVMSSLGRLAEGKPWQEATSTTSDGSGTVMRTSPTAFLPEDRWVGVTAFAAALTHGTANGIAAAILNAQMLRLLLADRIRPAAGNLCKVALQHAEHPELFGLLDVGEWLDGYEIDLQPGFAELARLLTKAIEALPALVLTPWARNSDPSLVITETPGRGGGWRAHETLVIALLAIDMLPADYQPWNALRRAVTTDGDSDTIGAVAGGLIGAIYPGLFTESWEPGPRDPGLRDRFEERYVRWIENEADDYPMARVSLKKKSHWWQRLVRA